MKVFGNLLAARVLRRIGLIEHVNFTEHIWENHLKIAIPIRAGLGLAYQSTSDGWMSTLLRTIISMQEGLFIDVGANVGQTLMKVKSVNAEWPYLGFEPDPTCVEYICELIKRNKFAKSVIVPAGLSDQAGILTLFLNGPADPCATVVPYFRGDEESKDKKYVAVLRLDDVVRSLRVRHVSTIKIDVEGSELNVLKGALQTIQRERPFILCEILPTYNLTHDVDRARFNRQSELVQLIRGMGYNILRIDHKNANLISLDEIEVHSNLEMCDYLFAPVEKLTVIRKS